MPIVGDLLAGRYRIDAPIGAGGMASVYRAYDLRLERDVAVKVLLPNLAADPTFALRFEREALAMAATAHPSVVKVFDVEPGDPDTGREPFYVMEWCDGGSLADRLAASGRLEPGELVAVVSAIADGLADLHRRGMVHRDVKPHNVLFDQGRARLADFGLARMEQRSELTALTASGATVGTLAYLAPELLSADSATPASDVYALGVVAFQGLTGRVPRHATSITELIAASAEPAPTVSSFTPELGGAFDGALAAALAIDPRARPGPLEFAERLTDALGEPRRHTAAAAGLVPLATDQPVPIGPADATLADIRPDTTPQPSGASPRWRRPGPAIVALGVVGLLVLGLLAMSSLLGGRDGNAGAVPTARATATPLATLAPTPFLTPSPAPPTPTPTPTPSPPPTAPADPAAEAYAILDRIDEAIEDIADEDELRDRDRDALQRRADEVRAALEAGDYGRALDRTERLNDEVDRVDDRVDSEAMNRLKEAVSQLDEAIPEG